METFDVFEMDMELKVRQPPNLKGMVDFCRNPK